MAASVVTTKVHSAAVSTPPRFLSSRTDPPSLPVPYNPPPTSSSKSSRSPPPPPPKPPANRSGPRPVHPQAMPQPSPSESAPITFKRLLRSPFEQTIRSTARSKGKADPSSPPSDGDRSTAITAKATQATDSAKERTGIFKRFETKVTLRRSRKPSLPEHSTHPVPSPPFNDHKPEEDLDGQDNLPAENGKGLHRFRLPGFTSFVSPSLTLASLSSPAVHLSSSPPSSPSSPPPSSSPARPIISPPAPLSPKRPSVANANPPAPSRPRNSHPHPHLPSSPSAPSLDPFLPSSPAPTTPTRSANLEPASPLATPTPASSSRNPQQQRFLLRTPRSSPDHSSSAPSSSPRQASPGSPRTLSPLSPRAVIPRGFASASTSNLNYPPSYSSNAIRRSSLDRRSPSPALRRASSPISPTGRPRALSPTRQHRRTASPPQVLTPHANGSTASISTVAPSNPIHRETMRVATSVLCKEMLRPGQTTGLGIRESEEVEQRMRALARLERVWGKSGASASGSVTQLAAVGSTLGASASAAGEERERRLFSEALRDGYVLCQLMNKLRPGSIARIDPREDGKLRMSNVTKFLASCSAHGLSPHDLFLRDDLIEATSDSLARVAKTVIALVKWAETPATPTQSQLLRGKSKLTPINTSALKPSGANAPLGSPYRFSSRAAMSSPNLSPHSPPSSPRSPTRNNTRRWTPSPGLPTLRFASPAPPSSSSHAETALGTETDRPEISARTSNRDEVPPIVPPRSPRRSRPSERSLFASGAGESLAPPFGESVRVSVADSTTNQSIASSNLTDTTTYSSLFDSGIGNRRNSGAHGKFGTIRTVTTEATSFVPSEWPSMTRTEASAVASFMVGSEDNLGGNDGNNHSPSTTTPSQRRRSSLDSPVRSRERKPSETIPVDLTRVVEESEEPASVGDTSRVASRGALPTNGRIERIKLKQGKWPDDFLDVFQAQNYVPSRPISIKRSSLSPLAISVDAPAVSHDDLTLADLDDLSASPSEPESQLPTLVTQRARHSVDAPVLAPKDPLHPRDSSPDPATHCSGLVPAGRVALRRNNTRAGITGQRNGIYVARRCSPEGATERDDSDLFVAIPFPPAVYGGDVPSPGALNPSSSLPDSVESTERGSRTVSGSGSVGSGSTQLQPLRGRFQSEADGSSSRRRPRPNSYDEFGVKPRRSRFESMVNLGAAAGEHASASDLMARDATEGSISRQTLVVREEGKSPIHYQLGNCIGRGQFGSVYRALNLNTGQMVAVKRIGLEGLKEEEIAQLMREVDLVKRLSHPSIVKYEGMARDENTLSIVLEYAENGSLGQTLKAFGKLNEKLVASYVVKILEGLDYLHRSDVVHCDLKAANILTTKNGNVKLSDFGVSLNLRAMEREIKDVAGTPNWMAPEVIELKGASTRSDIWSLGCTVIELLTGRPPYGDIANAMTVMFRIVEDDCPPIPDRFSDPLVAFLKECFHKDLTQRPSAEELFEHEWLKNHWGLNKDLRPQDSIPFLRRVSADLQKNDAARHLIANLDPPLPEFARDDVAPSSSPGRRSFITASPGIPIPEAPQAEPDIFDMREHTFVKTTFSKPVSCRVCMDPVKKGGVLCSHCSLIAHVKCAGRAPPTCDLRSKLLMHAHLAERGSPTDIFARLPPPPSGPASDGVGATSSRGSLDRERANSPSLSASSPTHPPVAYKALSPFKRSHASPSPDPPHSNSSVSLAGGSAPQKQQQGPVKSLLTESSVIRRKLSIILTRQRETNARSRPLSISSIGSSSPQTDSIRSLQTPPESISSRAARVDTSISGATESSTDANPAVLSASVHSGASTVPDGVRESSPMAADASSAPPSTSVAAPVVTVQDTHRTKRGRGGSKSSNCAIQ